MSYSKTAADPPNTSAVNAGGGTLSTPKTWNRFTAAVLEELMIFSLGGLLVLLDTVGILVQDY